MSQAGPRGADSRSFADDRQRAAWLAPFGAASSASYEAGVDEALDAVAAHLAAHLDIDAILRIAR